MTSWLMLACAFGSRILICLFAATALLAMADLAETSRQLAEQEDMLRLALVIYLNLAPSLLLQALPIALLLGVLLAITDLARSSELLALRTAGAGTFRLSLPPLIISVTLLGLGLYTADYVAPPGVARATRIQVEELGRMRSAWSPFHSEQSWFAAEEGGLYHVSDVAREGRQISRLWRYEHEEGRMSAILRADGLSHHGEDWSAKDVVLWRFSTNDDDVTVLRDLPRIAAPSHFTFVRAQPEALSRLALRDAIRLRSAQGQPTIAFELEARARWSMPLLGLGLCLVALGMGFRKPPSTHVEAASKGIAVVFMAWTLLATCRAMALSGMLSATSAALIPALIPAGVGLTLIAKGR